MENCTWDENGATLDGINFNTVPFVNKYNWFQREYYRMVNRHAKLLYEERMVKESEKRSMSFRAKEGGPSNSR